MIYPSTSPFIIYYSIQGQMYSIHINTPAMPLINTRILSTWFSLVEFHSWMLSGKEYGAKTRFVYLILLCKMQDLIMSKVLNLNKSCRKGRICEWNRKDEERKSHESQIYPELSYKSSIYSHVILLYIRGL